MKRLLLSSVLLCSLLLTGCAAESLADRVYTQAIGLTCDGRLTLYAQPFGETQAAPVVGADIDEALRIEEADAGGRVFIGHTELICLDGSCTLDTAEELLLHRGLSPACKVLYTDPAAYFREADSTAVVHSLRMAEQNGLLCSTELSTALSEWHGVWQTALLPDARLTGLVLLHESGSCTPLSDFAAKGMYWLRRNAGGFTCTLHTPEGEQVIGIERFRTVRRADSAGHLTYTVSIRTDEASPALCAALQRLVQHECDAAVLAMRAARADVIGMQDVLEAAKLPVDAQHMPQVTVEVVVS